MAGNKRITIYRDATDSFDLVEINNSNKPVDKIDVWLGKESQVDVYVNENIYKTIKKAKKKIT